MLTPGRCPRLPASSVSRFLPAARGIVLALLFPLTVSAQTLVGPGDTGAATEIVLVTARKVEEDLFEVPLSIQVIGGEHVDAADLSSLFELQFDVPGLVVASTGFFGAAIALRGVTDHGGGSLAVATHFDGVYLGKSALALSRAFDVERFEILKGPQGTLYGQNSTGGSINVLSRRPEPLFSASFETAVGSFDTLRTRGHVNLPIGESAVRVAVAASEGDGFIRNTLDARRFAAQDYRAARLSFGARPGERTNLTVTAQRVDDDGASSDLWLPPRNHLPDPSDIRLTTVTVPDAFLSMTSDILTLGLEREIGPLILESITGYAESVTNGIDDCGGPPTLPPCVRSVSPDRHVQRSQELRLRSAAGTRNEWLLGVYALAVDETTRFFLQRFVPIPRNDMQATTDQSTYAAFGQFTHRFAGRFSVVGGLRLSRDSARVTSFGTGLNDSPIPLTEDGSWDNVAWRVGVEYALDDTSLLYASVATGFKSGGVSIFRLQSGEFDDYRPEDLTAYELGFHRRAASGRWSLRASAFYYDFEDLQVSTATIVDNEPKFVIDNAAAAVIYGIDLSADVTVGERLTLSGAAVWMPKREFVEYASALAGSLDGNVLSRAPERSSVVSVDYRWPLQRANVFSLRLEYDYRSAVFFTADNEPSYSQEAFGLLNLSLRLQSDSWYAFATARNAQDTPYFTQAFLQSSPGLPANFELGVGRRF